MKHLYRIIILVVCVVGVVFLNGSQKNTPSDWKKYTNTEIGFSFQYPAQYELEEEELSKGSFLDLALVKKKIVYQKDSTYYGTDNQPQVRFEDYMYLDFKKIPNEFWAADGSYLCHKNQTSPLCGAWNIEFKETFTINKNQNARFVYFTAPDTEENWVQIIHNDILVTIGAWSLGNKELFKEIAQTFVFTK